MVLITHSGPETLAIGSEAPGFSLPATDGSTYSLDQLLEGTRGVVLAFTCNHCPYAQANEERFKVLVDKYGSQGMAFAAINPNDAANYPDDSFESMKDRALEQSFNFPYLRDETQETARAYGAVCTPHYFIVGPDRKVLFEGRLDDNWKDPSAVSRRELQDAIEDILAGRPVAQPTSNPMGCSIKWKG